MKILVVNAGSSSLKYQLMDMENESVLAKGNFERIGQEKSILTHKKDGNKHVFEVKAKDHQEAMEFIISKLLDNEIGVLASLDELGGIAHRIVHGGENLREACIVTEDVINEIDRVAPMAPLHNKAAIAGIRACQKVAPNIKMVTEGEYTTFSATATNVSDSDINIENFYIELKDKNGSSVAKLLGYIPDGLKKGEVKQIRSTAKGSFKSAYTKEIVDYTVKKE